MCSNAHNGGYSAAFKIIADNWVILPDLCVVVIVVVGIDQYQEKNPMAFGGVDH